MDNLFVRPDGTPMQFYLANLDKNMKNNYVLRIEDHGGKVEETENDNVLTFTTPDKCLSYDFVFDVKFVDDCIKQQKILNVNQYYIGDQRCNEGCLMSQFTMKTEQCMCTVLGIETFYKLGKIQKSTRGECSHNMVVEENNEKKKVKSKSISKKSSNNIERDKNIKSQKQTQTKKLESEKYIPEDKNKESESGTEENEILIAEISNKLKKFVEETVKDKQIDEHGNPFSYSKNFGDWETEAMLTFLLISDKVHEAKELQTWREAFRLKFLPRRRTANAMRNHLKRVILPNLESYNLNPKDLAKFQDLKPPRKVVEED